MAGRKSKYQQDYQSNKRARKTWVVAKYIRLSKEDEDVKDESNSVTSQNTILDEFVERNQNDNEEFVVYDTYIDDGYSGTDFDRPDFQRLLEDMKAGKFNTIIILSKQTKLRLCTRYLIKLKETVKTCVFYSPFFILI